MCMSAHSLLRWSIPAASPPAPHALTCSKLDNRSCRLFSRSWAANSSPFASRHIFTPAGEDSSRIASGAVAQAADGAAAEGLPESPYTASPCSSGARTPPSRRPSRSSAGSNADIYLTAPSMQSMSQNSAADDPGSPLGARGPAVAVKTVTPPQLRAPGDMAMLAQAPREDSAKSFPARATAASRPDSARDGTSPGSGDHGRSLVDQLRNRAAAVAPNNTTSPGRALMRKKVNDLSSVGESFTALAGAPMQAPLRTAQMARPQVTSMAAAVQPGAMASLDADTAMEEDFPHKLWAAVSPHTRTSSNSDATGPITRHDAAVHAHAVISPDRRSDGRGVGPDGEQLVRFHSHGSTVSSGSGRPPRSPRSSLRPSAAYGSTATPVACRSLPHAGSPPLGLGNTMLARPPSCDTVPMSPSPGPYATMARCQSQPVRTASDRERVEAVREGPRARGGLWRHGSAPTAAAAPSPTAAEYYRRSSGLRSVASSESGAPASPPALPPMDSSAAALLASEAMAAAAALGHGRVPSGTQRRLLEQVDSVQTQESLRVHGTMPTGSNGQVRVSAFGSASCGVVPASGLLFTFSGAGVHPVACRG